LEKEYNRKAIILACLDEESRLKGILPLLPTLGVPFKLNKPVTARRYSSLPRTPLGGILFDNEAVKEKLIRAAIKKVSGSDAACLQLKSYSSNLENGIDELKKILWRNSFYLQLPENPEEIKFGNKEHRRKIKWAVKKAKGAGIYLRELETEKDLNNWYKLYLETMRQHFVPPRPFAFFRSLKEHLLENSFMKILLAEENFQGKRRLLAGSMFLHYNDTVFYSFNGRSRRGLSLHANDLIQWEAINLACRKGYRFYDMGEVCEHNAGLAQFKNKWGCDSKPVYHYYFTSSESYDDQNLDIADDVKFSRYIWQKMPLGITKYMGTIVNRYL